MRPPRTTILGIETSSIVCSVGIADDDGKTVERQIIDPHIHSEKLLTLIGQVLERSETELRDVDAVAVSMGPGSFTGLRIGLSSAKGLCFSAQRRLIAVPTFDAIARLACDDPSKPERIHIMVDAKQGEFYYGSSRIVAGEPLNPLVVRIVRPENLDWRAAAETSALWISDREDVLSTCGVPLDRIRTFVSFCRGDIVARLGLEKYRRGEFTNLPQAEPLYLKEFVVRTITT
jgi:tRNA threonylcarbamoyladenosine biosynthesis protein TsaB